MLSDDKPLIHTIDGKQTAPSGSMPIMLFLVLVAVVVTLGTGAGYIISRSVKPKGTATSKTNESVSTGKAVGIADTKTFKDKAEGVLREGGVDGEGNFHLERPGGDSQNVYLTSSTVDLSVYIGKKVRVWGQTFQAKAAGWLMDVGLVEPIK